MIELEEPVLKTWVRTKRTAKQRTNQKTIAEPIIQEDCDTGNDNKRLGGNERSISKRSRRHHARDTRVFTIIDVGDKINVELHRVSYGHKQEHNYSVGYKFPFDTLPPAIDGVEQRGHTFKEQHNDRP